MSLIRLAFLTAMQSMNNFNNFLTFLNELLMRMPHQAKESRKEKLLRINPLNTKTFFLLIFTKPATTALIISTTTKNIEIF